jgi:hypothetical protein
MIVLDLSIFRLNIAFCLLLYFGSFRNLVSFLSVSVLIISFFADGYSFSVQKMLLLLYFV